MNTETVLGMLEEHTRRIRDINDEVVFLISSARSMGHTWEEIGDAQGITAQGAQQRHARELARKESAGAGFTNVEMF